MSSDHPRAADGAPTPDAAPAAAARPGASSPDWWRSAVIYEVYVRSFADGNRSEEHTSELQSR